MRSNDRAPSVTQADVARHAGVSQPLVSIVFRNIPGASPKTRERVLRAAEELGYRPDHRARLLATKRTGAIGVSFFMGHEFHADLVGHLYDAAKTHGFELLLQGVTATHTEADAVRSLMGYRCEALIMLAPRHSRRELEDIATHQPVIAVSRTVRSDEVDVVRVNDQAAAALATQHLIDLGHQRITHVHGGKNSGATERRAGYKATMRAAGLSEFVDLVSGGLSDMDGERAALEILERPELPTAILAFNDHCAAGVLAAVRAQRLRVPDDISVVGFDNVGMADLATVRLTTIDQNARELARQAMERAVARINGETPIETVIEPALVKRDTVGPPPIATPDPLRS